MEMSCASAPSSRPRLATWNPRSPRHRHPPGSPLLAEPTLLQPPWDSSPPNAVYQQLAIATPALVMDYDGFLTDSQLPRHEYERLIAQRLPHGAAPLVVPLSPGGGGSSVSAAAHPSNFVDELEPNHRSKSGGRSGVGELVSLQKRVMQLQHQALRLHDALASERRKSDDLRRRLASSEETLQAVRNGQPPPTRRVAPPSSLATKQPMHQRTSRSPSSLRSPSRPPPASPRTPSSPRSPSRPPPALSGSWALKPAPPSRPPREQAVSDRHWQAIASAVSAARNELPSTEVARFARDILVALMDEMEIERSTALLSDDDLEFERAHHQGGIDKARAMLARQREQLQRLQEERAHVASSREGYLLSKLGAQTTRTEQESVHHRYRQFAEVDEFDESLECGPPPDSPASPMGGRFHSDGWS